MDTSDMLEDDVAKALISIAEIRSDGKKENFLFCLVQTIAFTYDLEFGIHTIYWVETPCELDAPYFIVGIQTPIQQRKEWIYHTNYYGFYDWDFDSVVKGLFK